MKDASSTPAADDASDCVSSTTQDACAAVSSNAPNDRRRRAILSKRMSREAASNEGNSESFNIDFNQCAETDTDPEGVVTCVQPKSNAQAVSLGVLTGALVCALY